MNGTYIKRMNKIRNHAFKTGTDKYERWFQENIHAYESELNALRTLNIRGKSIEIGVGTGKFAYPLGIKLGIEPTEEMYQMALELGIDVICAEAEELPLVSAYFDWVLVVTTICFVNDPLKALYEIYRILRSGGHVAIAFVDKDTALGKKYLIKKDKSDFYIDAEFYGAKEIEEMMIKAGFIDIKAVQTLKDADLSHTEQPENGYGQGGFAVLYGVKA